jgi:hypothetical protein
MGYKDIRRNPFAIAVEQRSISSFQVVQVRGEASKFVDGSKMVGQVYPLHRGI